VGILNGKVAIITGASSGLGAATASALAREGAVSVLIARRESALKEMVERIRKDGHEAAYFAGDAGEEEDAARIVREVEKRYGRIDVLVNNAGVGYRGLIEDLEVSRFDEMMKTNVRGSYLSTKYALPVMKERKSGYIIYISSGAGKNGIAEMSGYCASKFALMGLSESVALEAKPFDVKVSVICPGSTNTEFHGRIGSEPTEESRAAMIQPEDIAETIVHLLVTPGRYWVFEVTTRAFLKGRK
jgi:3-oxoacyl-[acyl-carrier protein] reductase